LTTILTCNIIKIDSSKIVEHALIPKLLLLALAGACGTLSRYGLCEVANKVKIFPIPLGTFSVNIIGSFLFGFIFVLAEKKIGIAPDIRLILLTGFMGAFTTFSTFAFETVQLIGAAQWLTALGHIGAQVIIGTIAVGLGLALGRWF
jgi:CrcB protein